MGIVLDPGGNESSGVLVVVLERNYVLVAVPGVADATGVGSRIHPGAPALAVGADLGTAQAGSDIGVFAQGETSGFLDADNVVFDADVFIEVALVLVVIDQDAGTVRKNEFSALGVLMRNVTKDALAQIFEVFTV
jgi:hypothetical protein